MRLMTFAAAYGIYRYAAPTYDALLATLPAERGYIHFSVILFNLLSQIAGMNAVAARWDADIGPPDQHIYHVVGSDVHEKKVHFLFRLHPSPGGGYYYYWKDFLAIIPSSPAFPPFPRSSDF
jgi:hypothetical protein